MINTLTDIVGKKRRELLGELMSTVQELRTLPEGKLVIAKDGAREKWYVVNNGKRGYIPKTERELAERLARRKYLEARQEDLQKEIKACEAYLAKQNFQSKSETFLSEENRYHEFVFPDRPGDEIREWLQSEYQRNLKYANRLIFKSLSGNMVRSKSESMIDEMLFRYGIPFHYEEMLQLPDGTIYFPDFKAYSIKRRKFVYWEHFGMMDNPEYAERAETKIKTLMQNGFMPQDNLLITMETLNNPLDYEKVENMITLYLAEKPCYDYYCR